MIEIDIRLGDGFVKRSRNGEDYKMEGKAL
jgi:hypothetical protein